MAYGLRATPDGVEASFSAASREELFRDGVVAALDVTYGGTPSTGNEEAGVVPIQVVGDDDGELLERLVRECLDAAATPGRVLGPPRWLSFDDARVTANLPAVLGTAASRPIAGVRVTRGATPNSALVRFEISAH